METLARRHRCCQEKHSLETLVFSSSPHTISFIGFRNGNEKEDLKAGESIKAAAFCFLSGSDGL